MFLGFSSGDKSVAPQATSNQPTNGKLEETPSKRGLIWNSLTRKKDPQKQAPDNDAADARRASDEDEVKAIVENAPFTDELPHNNTNSTIDSNNSEQSSTNVSYLNFNFYDILSKTAQIPNLVIKGGKSKGVDKPAEPQHIQISNEELDAMKDEESMQHILDHLRSTYIERKLVGGINVSSTFATFSNSVAVSVNGAKLHDEALVRVAERKQLQQKWLEAELNFLEREGIDRAVIDLPPEEKVELPKARRGVIQTIAVTAIARILNALELRSMAYRNKSYAADITLTAGIEVSISAFMTTAFKFSISCSATCESLRRYIDLKKALAKEQREQKQRLADEKKHLQQQHKRELQYRKEQALVEKELAKEKQRLRAQQGGDESDFLDSEAAELLSTNDD